MGIFDSFRKPAKGATEPAKAFESDAALQLLFAQPLTGDVAQLQSMVRAYDTALKAATFTQSALSEMPEKGAMFVGEFAWGAHIVHLIAMPLAMPDEVVEKCVQPAAYDAEAKARIRQQNNGHALLNYKGRATNVTEQFVALALVAGALCGAQGLAVLNEGARTSLPAALFNDEGMKPSELWRSLPPLFLFAGFVKYEIEDEPGVWMRTYGLEVFGLPNLATLTEGHHQGEKVFGIFNNVVSYMMEQGPVLAAGHTMQIAEAEHMRLRELSEDEAILDDGEALLVAEFIGADEINEHVFGSEDAH